MATATYGGLWSAVFGALIGTLAGLYFLYLSIGSRALVEPAHLVQVALYLTVAISTAALIEALYRSRRRAEEGSIEADELAGVGAQGNDDRRRSIRILVTETTYSRSRGSPATFARWPLGGQAKARSGLSSASQDS